jgi:hypothetical protein
MDQITTSRAGRTQSHCDHRHCGSGAFARGVICAALCRMRHRTVVRKGGVCV